MSGPADLFGSVGAGLLSGVVKTIEIRSNVAPTIRLDVAGVLTSPASGLVKAAQPTVILSGPTIGNVVLAPHGQAQEGKGAIVLAALVAALIALGYFIGRESAP